MSELSERIQTGDWKAEKHVPVIECPDSVRANEFFNVSVSLGKAVAHPNTTEHHIRWMALFFQADGEKAPYQIAHVEFSAHGESTKGANQGPVYTNHQATVSLRIGSAGTLFALSLCNIHGLWQSAKPMKVIGV
jgi:superoxide reductase